MTVLHYRILLLLVGIMILTGCASVRARIDQLTKQPQSAGDQLLAKGIKSYEEGEYKSAAKNLQDAINAGFSSKIDSAKAHKYLAFIACCSDNTPKCNDEFRKAFEDDPNFALDKAEAGHPVWGPVYRKVRDQMKSK
ncbi:MAG: TssQ family T6SS-associated lipoprotein [Deltaproteobacteria bacterium]|nr:TssQ family T6SS-associated lipoprotein [Deltaproteobacteria bacterium]